MDMNYIGNLFFQICSMFYVLLIGITYFSKKRIKTLENRIYISLVVIIFITLIVDIASVRMAIIDAAHPFATILCKLYLVVLIGWVFLFTYYIFVISSKRNDGHTEMQNNKDMPYFKKAFYIIFAIYILASFIIMTIPLYIFSEGGVMYTYGPSAIFSYTITGVCLIFWLGCMVTNIKKIKDKKYVPAFAFIILVGIGATIQATFPAVLVVTAVAAYITVLTFFTIENPDLKMIELLNVTRDEAEKANRAKTDFLSSMSHEIRTPLNAIVGFSQCIEDASTIDEAKENARDVISASDTLLEIVNGILDISKIEAGKMEISNSNYDAKKLFESAAKLVKPRIDEKALDFQVHIAPDLPQNLYGDHANLKKVLANLLSNAAKYTERGYVKYDVNCVRNNDICRIMISVEDSGRGIKKEDIDKLFTKFQRFDEDRNTTIEGTGLGLAITKQIIQLMGGQIVVQSTFGSGSKFTVILNQHINLPKQGEMEVAQERTKEQGELKLDGKKILVVDDNKLNLKVAAKILAQYKPIIESVDSGFECIDKIKAGIEYDLILLDDMMPKMSGVETLAKLKDIPGFNIPVVALTANAIAGMREKYLDDGFDDYLAKPINKLELEEVLFKVLEESASKTVPVMNGKVPQQINQTEETQDQHSSAVLINPNLQTQMSQLQQQNNQQEEPAVIMNPNIQAQMRQAQNAQNLKQEQESSVIMNPNHNQQIEQIKNQQTDDIEVL